MRYGPAVPLSSVSDPYSFIESGSSQKSLSGSGSRRPQNTGTGGTDPGPDPSYFLTLSEKI